MDLCSPKIIRSLLATYGITPKKQWGQNFLVNRSVIGKLLDAASLSPRDTVLEVGPGVGAITIEIAKRAKRVVAVEKDKRLIPILKKTLEPFDNIEIVEGDIRKISVTDYGFPVAGYKLIGNLPFYLTNFLLRMFLESKNHPKEMTLVVQKEVGKRIVAKPPRMNLLAVSVQFYATPKIVAPIPRNSFWPQPEVEGSIIALKLLTPRALRTKDARTFFRVVRAGFSHPRKYLLSNLRKKLGIPREIMDKTCTALSLSPTVRAEEISLSSWEAIRSFLKKYIVQ